MTSSAPSDKTPTPADRPLYAKLARRVVIAIVLMIVILIPSVILILITKEFAATWASAAAIAGLAAVAAGGVEVAILTSVVMALITPIAIISGQAPVTGAALMALMCLTVGRMSRFGLHRATLLVPVFMAWMIIDPPFWGKQEIINRTDNTYLAWMAVFFLVGAIFPVIVLPFFLKKVTGLKSGAKLTGRETVGQVTRAQLRDIAELKMKDLNANDIEAAAKIIEGSARAMGLKIVEA